jgi:hypothetical protein
VNILTRDYSPKRKSSNSFDDTMQQTTKATPVREGQNYIIVGLQAIDSPIGSNCVNIAREISKHNKVLYVNYPFDTKSLVTQIFKPEENTPIRMRVLTGKESELQEISENLFAVFPRNVNTSISWLPDGKLYDWLNHRNNNEWPGRSESMLLNLVSINSFCSTTVT